MSDLPYNKDILRLAADAKGAGRLTPPCETGSEFNPACGDRATVDLRLENGRIVAVAHETKACVLAQASASILGAALPGRSTTDLAKLKSDVVAMLEGGQPPQGAFARYAHLADVAQHAGRHTCVLLPIEAALKAASQMREPSR
jgi:nitrogen fixation protein NifU and related proteins